MVQQILRWQIFLDEFDLTLKYIEGKNNVLADCFLRPEEKGNPTITQKRNCSGTFIDFNKLNATHNDEIIFEDKAFLNISEAENHSNIEDDNGLIKYFLNSPTMEELLNATLKNLNYQQQDNDLMQLTRLAPTKFPVKIVSNVLLVTHVGKHPIVRISLLSVRIINVLLTVNNTSNLSNSMVIFLLDMQWQLHGTK